MCSCHSIPECCVMFSGVKLSMGSFVLFQKKDRDNMLIKNWRPISLINVDIDIASKVLAFGLRKVIHKVIHYDQTAYVKGRYIGESVRLIDDLLAYVENENLDGILFAADIEKAFDSVEHNFIFASLKKFGEEESNCGIEFEGKYITMQQITPKIIYKLSVSSKHSPPTAREYFSRKFQIIRPDTLKTICLLPRIVTVDTKIRMFQ